MVGVQCALFRIL